MRYLREKRNTMTTGISGCNNCERVLIEAIEKMECVKCKQVFCHHCHAKGSSLCFRCDGVIGGVQRQKDIHRIETEAAG